MITRGILWNCFYMWQDLPSLWCNIATNCDQFFLARTQESKTPCKIIRALPTLWFSQQTSQFVYPRGVPIVCAPARNVAWSEALRELKKSRTFPIVIILPPWGSDTTLLSWSIWTDTETLLLDKIQIIPQDRLRIIQGGFFNWSALIND